MSRLVYADELRKTMCHRCNKDYSDDPCEPSDCVFVNAIKNTPTAYDVEAVVDELEERVKFYAKRQLDCEERRDIQFSERYKSWVRGLCEAIEIVKKGGLNE